MESLANEGQVFLTGPYDSFIAYMMPEACQSYTVRCNNNDKFYETVRFQNIYNRLIIYDAQEYHRANNFDVGDSDRLTLVFFIGGINSDTPLPKERVVNEDFDATIESMIKLKT